MDVYGLIGKNLSHSKSPEYFNKRFRENNIDAEYRLFDVESVDEIESIFKNTPNLKGLNVTIPYKRSLAFLLDGFSNEVKQSGSVNTIKIIDKKDGKHAIAYNTDISGFSNSIKDIVEQRPGIRALILGTGGVAHTVSYVFRKLGVFFYFVSRNPSKVEHMGYNWVTKKALEQYQIIINCTPVGMHPEEDRCPDINYEFLGKNNICYDCVYNPQETLFLKKAKQRGALTIGGMQMFLHQAEESWKIWMG
ncbi:MAG: shikimate dehydrogenase [Chlorobi bacterium]|nr:shikimate dehydrogenase [Chlorobiota bacterium]